MGRPKKEVLETDPKVEPLEDMEDEESETVETETTNEEEEEKVEEEYNLIYEKITKLELQSTDFSKAIIANQKYIKTLWGKVKELESNFKIILEKLQ